MKWNSQILKFFIGLFAISQVFGSVVGISEELENSLLASHRNENNTKNFENFGIGSISGRVRHPKFLFNVSMPIGGSGVMPGFGGTGGGGDGGVGNLIGTLGTSAILLKGGVLGVLTALKAAILPPIFLGVLIAFLVAGVAFFTCSILDCGSVFGFGGGGPGFGGLGSPFSGFGSPFNRNSFDFYDKEGKPIYQTLEHAYQKYGDEDVMPSYLKKRV